MGVSCRPAQIVVLCFLLLQVTKVMPKNILMLITPVYSHCFEMKSIGVELAKRGHKVTAFLPDYWDSEPCMGGTDIRVLRYTAPSEIADQLIHVRGNLTSKFFEPSYSMFDLFYTLKKVSRLTCEMTLTGARNMKETLIKEAFDAAIVDAMPITTCYFGVPHMLSIPAFAQGSYISQYHGNLPLQANSYPHQLSTFSTPLILTQRIVNSFAYAGMEFIVNFLLPDNNLGELLGKEYTALDFNALFRYSELFLETTDYVLDFPKATFPNFIQTGPLTATAPKRLTSDVETFVSKAKSGVIFVSFGSVINSFPVELQTKLVKVFGMVNQLVVFKSNVEQEGDKLKTVKWITQNNILGHNKTVLFISHCGKNSFFESLYHGVPIICAPLNADAFATAAKVQHFNVGAKFDIRTASAEEILKIINGVLNDKQIEDNMKRASTIIKDRPFTPPQVAANAIEHVLKYGSQHMTSPLRDLSFFAYAGGDVWFVVFAINFFIIWLISKLFLKCVLRR